MTDSLRRVPNPHSTPVRVASGGTSFAHRNDFAFASSRRGTLVSLADGELRKWYSLLVLFRQAKTFGEFFERLASTARKRLY